MLICDGANGWIGADEDGMMDEMNSLLPGEDLGFAVSRFLTQDQVRDEMRKSPVSELDYTSEVDSQEPEKLFPIPFITCKEGSYALASGVSDRLSQISKPICIVTVFGAPKTGKSTLIIRSLYSIDASSEDPIDTSHDLYGYHQDNGADSEELERVAFWMWSKTISVAHIGGAITMLILESGRGDENILFAISVLLSTHVLYNGAGLLDEHRILDLHTIRNLTRCCPHFSCCTDLTSRIRKNHSIFVM
jgi:hypothetical protein